MTTITIVSPVFQAEATVHRLVEDVTRSASVLAENIEIILIDDRSSDNSWSEIKKACSINKHVKGIRLSRNFGQHYAIAAGLDAACGDWIIVMDCDLQDRPDQIPILYQKAQQGYDIVCGRRRARKDSLLKRFYSKAFYAVFSYLTNTQQDPRIANYGIYHRKVIEAIKSMNDSVRYLPAMAQWVGFRKTSVDIVHNGRSDGESTYDFKRLVSLAVDNIIYFSGKPLRLVAKSGLIMSGLATLIGCFYLYGYLTGSIRVAGYTSLIISVWLTAGLNIFMLGIVGIYVEKAFEKIKNRPQYIIDEVVEFE